MSADQFPDPLVPAEVDLRDFQYMELDVQLLRDSRFAAEVDAEAFRAGVLLWCAAWHQVPAASLPDNDVELSNLAGFGRVVKEWRKVRGQALSLFVRCSDGRLYHEIIAAKALSAWNKKLQHHYDRARDRLRKVNKARAGESLQPLPELTFEQWNANRLAGGLPMERAEASVGIPQNVPPASAGIPPENALKGEGTERRGNGEGTETSLSAPVGADGEAPSSPPAPPPEPPQPPEPPVPPPPEPAPAKTPEELAKAELWAAAKSLLEQQGMPRAQCGTFVGKLAKDYPGVVLEAVRAAVVEQPADAASWLKAACKSRAAQRPLNGRHQPTEAERAAENARTNAEAKRLLFGASTQKAIDHA